MTDNAKETLARRLSGALRILTSEREGEAVAGAEGLLRLVRASAENMTAVRELAHRLERPGNGMNREEVEHVYTEGFTDGVRAAESKQYGDEDFRNTNGAPTWEQIALFCHRRSERLNDWEQGFVRSMAAWTLTREPTAKQAPRLKAIYLRLGGKL